MECPSCNSPTRVLESRRAEHGAAVRRRRHCEQCGERFTTYERREAEPSWVAKRDGSRQRFDPAKLRTALARATHKRDVSTADVEKIVASIGREIEEAGGELSSEQVRHLCLEGLGEIDTGAYLQFAGVALDDPDSIREVLASASFTKKPRKQRTSKRSGSIRTKEEAQRPSTRTAKSR